MHHKRNLISPYHLWEPPTWIIPKMYWDAMSQEQRIHAICRQIEKLICYADYLGGNVDDLTIKYDELKADFDKFMESGFDDYYYEQIEQWIINHMPEIISTYVKQVFFGLTLEGNFIAYIPQGSAWDDVLFDTGQVYELDTYGRLMLFYETDASSNVWQDVSIVK